MMTLSRPRARATAVTAVIAAALVSATLAPPALAARGGGSAAATSDLWVASVDGWSTTGRTAATPTLAYGSTLTFGTVVEPLAGWEYAMVVVSCYQDVNGDGVVDPTLWGPDVVLSSLQRPSTTFTLGGNTIWTLRGGGAAVCRADLDAYGVKGGKQTIRVLRSLPLPVSA